jgi:hypothetical protein
MKAILPERQQRRRRRAGQIQTPIATDPGQIQRAVESGSMTTIDMRSCAGEGADFPSHYRQRGTYIPPGW